MKNTLQTQHEPKKKWDTCSSCKEHDENYPMVINILFSLLRTLQQATSGSQDITVSRVRTEVHECTSEARVVGCPPDNGQMVHGPTRSPEHRDRWRLGLSDSPPDVTDLRTD